MIVGLDTSVVVRLLCGEPKELALVALDYVRARQRAHDRMLVSDWVIAETYYVLQYHYGATKRDVLAALRSFLDTPGMESSGEAAAVLSTPGLESAKPGFIDRIIHQNYSRAGVVEMASLEKSAAKLDGVRVLFR